MEQLVSLLSHPVVIVGIGFVLAVILGMLVLFILLTVPRYFETRRYQRYVGPVRASLQHLPEVQEVILGRGYHYLESGPRIYAEGPMTVVLQHRGRPAALVSFFFEKTGLYVLQLQGIRKAKLFDVGNADEWMVEQAERIARALDCDYICIICAMKQDYMEAYDDIVHQKKIIQRYDVAPQARGFDPPLVKDKWWRKYLSR